MVGTDVLTCGCKDVLYPCLNPRKVAPAGWIRRDGMLLASLREDGSYLEWYASGGAGEVVDWIGDALHDAGWSWSAPERD